MGRKLYAKGAMSQTLFFFFLFVLCNCVTIAFPPELPNPEQCKMGFVITENPLHYHRYYSQVL